MQPFPTIQNYGYYQQSTPKFVNNFSEISASDVPMDGRWVLFGKNDMSEVQARAWTPNGMITTLNYKLDNAPTIANTSNSTSVNPTNENGAISGQIKALQESIDTLNDKIDKLNKTGGKKE